jgi:hypothetical protein
VAILFLPLPGSFLLDEEPVNFTPLRFAGLVGGGPAIAAVEICVPAPPAEKKSDRSAAENGLFGCVAVAF